MGVLFEIVEEIQERINKESNRPWMEVIEEYKKENLQHENTYIEKR